MDTIQIFKKAASLTWRYRLLWLFGFFLALTVSDAIFWLPFAGNDRAVVENRIILSDASTIFFPGEGLTIDFSSPGTPVFRIDELEPGWYREQGQDVRLSDVGMFLSTLGMIILISMLLSILLHYTSQAALIRMVDEHARNGEMVGVRRGLRLGWSRVAVKLFLIDLSLVLLSFLVFALLFALGISPLFLLGWESITESVASIVGISLFVLASLSLFGMLAFFAAVILSISRPVMHQACAVDGLGVVASIRQGLRLLGACFGEVIITWLVWLAVRLVWLFALIPIIIILSPLLLLSMGLGMVVGAVPAILAAGIASLFVSPIFAWLIGAVFGIPLFLVVTFVPITFLCGLVEVFKSSFWTLSYREFRPLGSLAPLPAGKSEVAELKPVMAQ